MFGRNYLLFFLIILGLNVSGQEVLRGLHVNPVVKARAEAIRSGILPDNAAAGLDTIPMTLPFHDDFSALGIYPSAQRWIDHYAFENDDYPIFPVNIGVMTLDAVNDSGNMYPEATPGPAAFIADHLTSRYIRLDSIFQPTPKALTPADSVYFSFYYQPQGRGSAPQNNDSLILRFLVKPAHDTITPASDTIVIPDKWRNIWYSNGMPLDTFNVRNNKWFARVMIPITDTVFFKKDFRFQFFNYASLASSAEPSWQSNTDHWNIDEVYLNRGRSHNDTIIPEVRFLNRPTGLLKKYAVMPYPQYCNDPTNELRDTLDVLMNNRDIVPHTCTYKYTITRPGTTYSKSYSGGNFTIDPYNISPYVTYQKFAHPEQPYLLPVDNTDSADFVVTHIVKENSAGSRIGDTVVVHQKFQDYYAYDDGTPEASYGLTPAGSKLAVGFKLNKSPDTLRAVRIYFNQTLSSSTDRFFYLCVWNDNAGKPGDTIYSRIYIPRHADSLNKFVTYHIFPPLVITGTFYVGTIQTTGDNLSIGYDRNNNSQQSIFYNTFGTWTNSSFLGSLLIRPVVGKKIPLGIHDLPQNQQLVSVYPNPCSGNILNINIINSDNSQNILNTGFVFRDITGRVMLSGTLPGDHQLDVSRLGSSIYFLELKRPSGERTGVSKVIITR